MLIEVGSPNQDGEPKITKRGGGEKRRSRDGWR